MSKKDLVKKLKHLQTRRAREYNENANRIVALENFCESAMSKNQNVVGSQNEVKFEEGTRKEDSGLQESPKKHLAKERGVDSGGIKRLLNATTKELRFKAEALSQMSEKYNVVQGRAQMQEEEIASLRTQIERLDDANKVLSVENQVCVELLYKAKGIAIVNQD